MNRRNLIAALVFSVCLSPHAEAQPPALDIKVKADKKVAELPGGPLFWRVETFATAAEAQTASSSHSPMVETLGNVSLFTLGQQAQPSRGGAKVAEVGPLAKVEAGEYLLRVNEGHGPPGGMTPVHTHPGSEAFFVLEGELNQKTAHGVSRVSAGQALAGHGADSPMQVSTSGSTNAAWFALFVLDASKPVTSPAKFD